MNWIKQNWTMVVLGIASLVAAVSIGRALNDAQPNTTPISNSAYLSSLTPSIEEIDPECVTSLLARNKYFESEKLSEIYTFEKYPTSFFLTTQPVDLDTSSSKSARMFRTSIRQDLERGVEFAGHYTIASSGLRSNSTWIVDRSNGRAYEFPYAPYELDFRKNSNLLIKSFLINI